MAFGNLVQQTSYATKILFTEQFFIFAFAILRNSLDVVVGFFRSFSDCVSHDILRYLKKIPNTAYKSDNKRREGTNGNNYEG